MLIDRMQSQGSWLFRWRSFVPLMLLPVVATAILQFSYPNGSHRLDMVREFSGLGLALLGLTLRALTVGFVPKGTSGRNTTRIKADALNTTGMYSIVRHPLYTANFLVFAGVLIALGNWWLILFGSVAYWFYYERIMLAEEKFLLANYGNGFQRWAANTPAVLPRIRCWSPPELPFSWRNMVRREYTTMFLILSTFTAVEILGDYIVLHEWEFDPVWQVLFVAGAAMYIVVRFLKKWTHLLDVTGR